MMNKEENKTNWGKDSFLLASLDKANMFSVPNNYFENLPQHIISQIALNDLKTSSFKVSHSYFENLKSQIEAHIQLDTQKELSSKNNNGFITPEYYFEDSKTIILNKIVYKDPVILRILNRSFIKYAAAACILLSTSLGIFFNIQRSMSISYQLSKVPDENIETYLKQTAEASDIPIIIENLNDKPVFTIDESPSNLKEVGSSLK